jgi:hypothetical protein
MKICKVKLGKGYEVQFVPEDDHDKSLIRKAIDKYNRYGNLGVFVQTDYSFDEIEVNVWYKCKYKDKVDIYLIKEADDKYRCVVTDKGSKDVLYIRYFNSKNNIINKYDKLWWEKVRGDIHTYLRVVE